MNEKTTFIDILCLKARSKEKMSFGRMRWVGVKHKDKLAHHTGILDANAINRTNCKTEKMVVFRCHT